MLILYSGYALYEAAQNEYLIVSFAIKVIKVIPGH